MSKLMETVAGTVIAAGVVAAITNGSSTRADAATAWSYADRWSSSHERVAWLFAVSILTVNTAWWVFCATGRRRQGVDVFAGELSMPSVTSVLFTVLVISGSGALTLHLAAQRSLWAVVPAALAGWLAARAISAAHYRWNRLTGPF